MKAIAFFAHDERDAAVIRRVFSFRDSGFDIVGFSMRRDERIELGWNSVDLGRTHDAQYVQRLVAIVSGAKKAAKARVLLEACDVVYARNLDMVLCARLALLMTGLSRPLVYECLDVHRLMHRKDIIGAGMRALERAILRRSSLLVVSSPAFIREYFDVRHPGQFCAHLVENRIADAQALGPRPGSRSVPSAPLRIGWFGVLRCARSFELLELLADRFGADIEIVLRGYPDLMLPDFHERVRKRSNMRYRGRYKSPDQLSEIYASVDLVWAGDFHDPDFNSAWLLPNRLYEGGYFAAPAVAPASSQTGRWIKERGAGFVVEEPLETSLPALVKSLIESPGDLALAQARLLSLPKETFVQPRDEMRDVINAALARGTGLRRAQARRNGAPPIEAISSDC